ncbi:RidA family protein [Hoeflea sp. TYP-13]|uniref:RidA family protein n=1 Tax=Hoeflea sp. TYP-13 TaxID=3230023 RepID=UPI0034C5E6B7
MINSVDPPDVPRHRNPIPAAAIHRGILASSAISGLDPSTGTYPGEKAVQVETAFRNMQSILEAAGANWQDVIKMDLYFRDKADRKLVNPHWLEIYPDESARPARHAHVADLPDGCCLQITFLAVMED